ncbi:MAG: branched-chain amino acid ABC transporter substrate-binding protein [Comamonadaceae bacterium]|nr:MAG: branched-chain amino acid ABC transporter substrate-binding protein [Comamonadaceae bacterium]
MTTRRQILRSLYIASVAAWAVMPAVGHAQAAGPIRIGMTVSSAGAFALASQSGTRGIDIWVDEVNAKGGIDVRGVKRKVELVKLDDRSDKQMVTRVYEKLITDDKVDVLFGPFGSTLTGAAATVTERLDRLMVIWSAASDQIYQQGFKSIVSATQMPVSAVPSMSIELAAQLGFKKIAIPYSDEPFTASMAEAAKQLAESKGMQVVLFDRYPKGQKDFSTILQKAKALGAEVFYPASYESDLISMLGQLKQLNINFPFAYMHYGSTPQFLELGKDTEYLYSQTLFHPDIKWKVNAGYDRERFLAAYARLNKNATFAADFQTAQAYGAGVVLEQLIVRAGALDAAALKKAALDLSGKLTVLPGEYAIDSAGKQLKMVTPTMQNQPGRGLVAVWPAAVATGKPISPAPAWADRK